MTVQLFDPEYWDQDVAHAVARALREEGPVHRAILPNRIPVWVIGDYEQARAALADPRLAKDSELLNSVQRQKLIEAGQVDTELSGMFGPSMLFRDGDEHKRLRELVSKEFTRQRVSQLRPRIEELAEQLLRALPRERPVDLVAELAMPLPLAVICELIGVPEAERPPLLEWTTAMMEDLPERTIPASRAMAAYFGRLIEVKQTQPGADMLSALLQAASDEDRLSPEELMGTLFLLIVAGHETTANMIGNSVRHLLADRDQWLQLGQDPALIPAALDELLRYDSPVALAPHRVTREPVVYGETEIPAGEIVLVGLLSANRDPARFCKHADQLDLRREDARGHLAFGHGVHYCLGAPLGRMEGEIVLRRLTQRFPNARLAVAPDALTRKPSAIMHGYSSLPVLLGD